MKSENSNLCIVTGGSGGIGMAISEYLMQKGYRIAVLDKYIDKANEKFKKEIGDNQFLALVTDITKLQDVNNNVEVIIKKFGSIGSLINNAGVVVSKQFLDETRSEWDFVIDVNLNGVFNCCKAVVPHMIDNKFGRIVNISSLSGQKSSVYSSSAYCASKAGVIGFSRCLASQVAKNNIRVNCVAPCTTESPMIADLDSKIKEDYIKSVPLGRIANPMDIAYCVYFLISDFSDFITGETINLNGGLLMK
jgi:3-oxoacyl-[acyl-carrier protein] reductase